MVKNIDLMVNLLHFSNVREEIIIMKKWLLCFNLIVAANSTWFWTILWLIKKKLFGNRNIQFIMGEIWMKRSFIIFLSISLLFLNICFNFNVWRLSLFHFVRQNIASKISLNTQKNRGMNYNIFPLTIRFKVIKLIIRLQRVEKNDLLDCVRIS